MCKVQGFRPEYFALFLNKKYELSLATLKTYSPGGILLGTYSIVPSLFNKAEGWGFFYTKHKFMTRKFSKTIMCMLFICAFAGIPQELLAQNGLYLRAGYNSSTIGSRGFNPFFGQNRLARSIYEPGFLFSSGFDYQIKGAFRLRIELNYLREHAAINHSGYEIGPVEIFSMVEEWSSHQVQIPLLFRWEKQLYPLFIGINAGPGLSVILAGDRVVRPGQVYDHSLDENVPNPKDFHLFYEKDFDVSMLLGLELGLQTSQGAFVLEGRMTQGLVHFDQQKNFAFHQKSFAVLAGYRINLGP